MRRPDVEIPQNESDQDIIQMTSVSRQKQHREVLLKNKDEERDECVCVFDSLDMEMIDELHL